ncbi:permease-like cell division protein FtsX, partial [Candidatus Pacearchaeota archaeon]|nr:permease-like cell division protein FtsX [Candidatus Pacearchaeota archaeon]
ALSYASDSVILSVGRKVDIRVEIQSGVENYTIQTLKNRLGELQEIDEIVFISQEEALRGFGVKYPNVISFLENNNLKNPLPNVLRIVGSDVSVNNQIIEFLSDPQFARIINQDKLESDTEQKSRNEKILNITQFIKGVGLWLNIIFAVVAILIIFNSINLSIHTHRHEINIMRLVGANKNFIRGGYVVEGLIYAVTALIISLALSQLTLLYLSKNLIGVITNESLLVGLDAVLLHFEDNFWLTFTWQLFGAILVGLFSSFLAIELYLKKKFSF